jgi:NAD(P)-dependent dehydrogenase (short-subunit alcohol dehydrogenase family)
MAIKVLDLTQDDNVGARVGDKLKGRVAFVTGGTRGIGAAICRSLASQGAVLAAGYAGNDKAAGEFREAFAGTYGTPVSIHKGNVGEPPDCRRTIDEVITAHGRLDILVNNAGILRDRMIVNMTEQEWDAVINVHLKGHFAPTRHAAAYWRERSKEGEDVRGRVINTSSPSGVFGNIGQSNYGAAKAGIAGFTLIVAQELQRYGVTVNCLAPNARTRMTEETFDMGGPVEGFDPLDPANMSPLVVALAADDAQHITGQVFHVWGGAINALHGWDAGELFTSDERWDADALLHELLERFPDGVAPPGMVAGMQAAGGQSLRAQ